MIRKVTFEEANDLLSARPDITLVDVREEPEYLTGHAVDAVLLPVDEITEESFFKNGKRIRRQNER